MQIDVIRSHVTDLVYPKQYNKLCNNNRQDQQVQDQWQNEECNDPTCYHDNWD